MPIELNNATCRALVVAALVVIVNASPAATGAPARSSAQDQLIGTLETYSQRWVAAIGNDPMQHSIEKERGAALCALAPVIAATTEWTGKLAQVGGIFLSGSRFGGSGNLRIEIEFGPSSIMHEVNRDSPIGIAVAKMRAGTPIRFTGKFEMAGGDTCITLWAMSGFKTTYGPNLKLETLDSIEVAR